MTFTEEEITRVEAELSRVGTELPKFRFIFDRKLRLKKKHNPHRLTSYKIPLIFGCGSISISIFFPPNSQGPGTCKTFITAAWLRMV